MDKFSQLHPDLQKVYTLAKANYVQDHPGNVPLPSLNETYRSNAVQTAYHAQGRLSLQKINELRKAAGLYLLREAEGKKRVTNALAGQSPHNFLPSRAFDVLFTLAGKAHWEEHYYLDFGRYVLAAAKTLGVAVTYGGSWKTRDLPHSELTAWRTLH